ncbi:MAG TPA: hypothetical protein VEI97_09820 [bacterium]|nr:hypothetical protein [bacterium]
MRFWRARVWSTAFVVFDPDDPGSQGVLWVLHPGKRWAEAHLYSYEYATRRITEGGWYELFEDPRDPGPIVTVLFGEMEAR